MSLAALVSALLLGVAVGAVVFATRARRAAREAIHRAAVLKEAARASRARVATLGARLDELKARAGHLHHAVPEPDALEGMLPLRLPGAIVRAMQPEARSREARLKAVSPAYSAALLANPPDETRARTMQLQGLTWWVPAARHGDAAGVDRNAAHQDFPYRAIAQTRDVAVGGLMLDIGANLGRMSVPRVILGDVQAAYCAEPDPTNHACLVRNVVDNGLAGLVMPDWLAIGAENTTVRLHRARSAGGHRVLSADAPSRGEIVEVPCVTLDTWTERLGIDLQQVSFIKVDVQGSEMDVLRGAAQALACEHIAWQIEIDPATLKQRGIAVQALYGELARHFTHTIDLNRRAGGPRVRPIGELAEALAYLDSPDAGRTDVLFFCLKSLSTTAAAMSGMRIS